MRVFSYLIIFLFFMIGGIIFSPVVVLVRAANISSAAIEEAIMNKDYEKAKQLGEERLKQTNNPTQRVMTQYYLALSYLRLGEYSKSRETFTMVMEAKPPKALYAQAAVGLIEALHITGFYGDVIIEAKRFLDRDPRSAYASAVYLKMGRAYLKLMKWQEANTVLRRVMDQYPQSVEAPLAKQLLEEKQYFAVQVGSFEDKALALALMERLKGNQIYAYLVETTSNKQKKLYRVRVGQLTSLDQAKELENQLNALGYATLIYP